ncbi:MAG: hypothetical protein EPO26_14305 [Chloroflexota bacterium]|nr:MAG: hypothetical protein EPO26_14305 [Chloroflexota bacterium]
MIAERPSVPADGASSPSAIVVGPATESNAPRSPSLRGSGRLPVLAISRQQLIEQLIGLALLVATAVPFALARSGGFTAGLDGLAAAASWDAIVRVLAAPTHLFLPRPIDGLPESPLWTLALFALNGAVGWTGLSLALIARIAGLIAFAVGFADLARVGIRLGLSRLAVAVTLGIVLVDPWTAFSRIAGSSAGLVFAITAASVFALLERRDRHLRWLLAALAFARVDGGVGVLAFGAVFLADRLWTHGQPKPSALAPIAETMNVVGPALFLVVAMAIWESLGERFPIPRDWLPGGSDIDAAMTWFRALGWLFILFVVAGLALVAIQAPRRLGPRAFIVPLIVPLAVIWLGQRVHTMSWAPDGLLESEGALVVPFLSLVAALLVRDATNLGAAYVRRRTLDPRAGLVATAGIAMILAAPWLVGSYRLWLILPETYASAARDIAEGARASGTWMATRVPARATIAILPGGEPAAALLRTEPLRIAVRAPNAMIEEVLATAAVDYVIAPPSAPIAQSPRLRAIARTEGSRPDGSYFEGVTVYAFQSNATEGPVDSPVIVRVGEYALFDHLDVGDPASEVAHFYASTSTKQPEEFSITTPTGWIRDDGRVHEFGRGAESFFLRLPIGRDVIFVIRYLSDATITARLDIEQESLEVPFERCFLQTCELALFVPARAIVSESTRARLVIPPLRGGKGTVTILRYWTYGRP